MLKIFTLLLLMPLTVQANEFSNSTIQIEATNPAIAGMEIELESGEVVSLKDYLVAVSQDEQLKKDGPSVFGGEVPWPKPPTKKEKED